MKDLVLISRKTFDELIGLLIHCNEYLEGFAEKPDTVAIEKAISNAKR